MASRVQNRLGDIRRGRGAGVSDLASRVGVSRQTIHAIESGAYVPNTELTLRLARELEVSVEELFSLQNEQEIKQQSFAVEILSSAVAPKGQPVRLGKVGEHWLSVPATAVPYFLPEADGVISRPWRARATAEVDAFQGTEDFGKRLVLAGCDPATTLLTRVVEKVSGVDVVCAAASSARALAWLKAGKVHIAGSHLEDPNTGEFNLSFVQSELSDDDFAVVTFAAWEQGFVVAPGNPKEIRRIEDLARRNVTFMNREEGSGSRALFDQLLKAAGIPSTKIRGYDRVAAGHLPAAYAIAAGEADCCLATQSAARAFGLDFIAVHTNRYDFVLRRRSLELPAVQAFLDVLQRAGLRRKLEVLAGYDTSQTGAVLA